MLQAIGPLRIHPEGGQWADTSIKQIPQSSLSISVLANAESRTRDRHETHAAHTMTDKRKSPVSRRPETNSMPISPITARAVGHSRLIPASTENRPAQKSQQTSEVEASLPLSDSADGRGKGVVRKLLDGHFRGVAEVRLQINFREEIAAAQQQQGLTLVTEGTESLKTSISDELTNLSESGSLSPVQQAEAETLFADFISSVDTITSAATDPQSAVDDLRTAAREFLTSLQNALSPAPSISPDAAEDANAADDVTAVVPSTISETAVPPDETPDVSETTVSLPPTEDAASDDSDVIPLSQQLSELINQVLTEIESGLNEVSLPEPTPQEGNNGVAFEKFLAIYRSHQSIPTQAELEATGDDAAPEPPISETA